MSQENLPAKTPGTDLRLSTGGVFENVERLAQAIKALGERHNLVVPGGAIGGKLPLLHAAGISFVFVDPVNETYSLAGSDKRGIGKTALDRVASAAGVRWNPHLCGRVDDGSNPYVIEYQVAGSVLQLDGTERLITGSKRLDLRAEQGKDRSTWGADSQEIARVADKATPPRDPWPQILQVRQHILSLAETKAKNRAIRSLGVRTSYTPAEIERGFAIVRLQFTGHSDDPEIGREIELMIARRALQATEMMYGPRPEGAVQSLAVTRRVAKLSPAEEPEEEVENGKTPPAATCPETDPAGEKTEPEPASAPKQPQDDPLLICGPPAADGKYPKEPASRLSVAELRAKIAAYEKRRPEWNPRWAPKNEAELKAMKAWLAYKEFDPRQGTLDMEKARAAADGDKVPY
jgi:hypothetical protein